VPVTFRVLGPVEVVGPKGCVLGIGGRGRALVGLLALNPGRLVAVNRLVAALWGDDPPRTAERSIQSHIARVRRALEACGLPGVLQTQPPGYRLSVDPSEVDAAAFEQRVAEAARLAAAGDLPAAVARLRAGLELFQGEPFADAPVLSWGAAEVARLAEARLTAVEDLWEAELRLGGHTRAVDELERYAASHPARERLAGLLMLALYRCGRAQHALDVYRALRERMADELGVDPGPQLQETYVAILRHDASLQVGETGVQTGRLAQVPPGVGHFTGRATQLAALDSLMETAGEPVAALVCGPAGVGKTALVSQWALGAAKHFPAGQLFVDLRGDDPHAAVAAADALGQLLRGLGVPSDRMPTGEAERSALFRSLMHDRRALLVLDNAAHTEQVLPLMPSSPSNVVVVTSRHRLPALATHHHLEPVLLDHLEPGESMTLLAKVLGPDRVAAEPDAANGLAEQCGGMPLALRIVAAKLATRPPARGAIADLVAELAKAGAGRLDALSLEGESRSVRRVLAGAYRWLPPETARLFRLLGLHPGLSFGVHQAAALGGVSTAAARVAVDSMVEAHLLQEIRAGRFRFHDLIRFYAAERAVSDEDDDSRFQALQRLFTWYLVLAHQANKLIDPGRDRVVVKAATVGAVRIPTLSDQAEALSVLDDEHDSLVAIVAHAARHGAPLLAFQLSYLLAGFFESRGHGSDREEACRWGLSAARSLGDPVSEGVAHSGLGLAYIMTRRFDEALVHLDASLERMRVAGDRRGQGHAYNNIAIVHTKLRRFPDAADAFEHALRLQLEDGHRYGIGLALNNLGYVRSVLGEHDRALEHLTGALAIFRELGNGRLESAVLRSMGEALHVKGEHEEALRHLSRAVEIKRRLGDDIFLAETLNEIAVVRLAIADHRGALAATDQALELSRALADRHLEAVTEVLAARALSGCGDLDAAEARLRHALALRRHVPDAHEEEAAHRELTAIKQARRAMSRSPRS